MDKAQRKRDSRYERRRFSQNVNAFRNNGNSLSTAVHAATYRARNTSYAIEKRRERQTRQTPMPKTRTQIYKGLANREPSRKNRAFMAKVIYSADSQQRSRLNGTRTARNVNTLAQGNTNG